MTFNLLLVAVVAAALGAGLTWRHYNNQLATERAMRREAHARCADLQAQRDQLAHDGVRLRGLAADLYASWAECDADADVWWQRYNTASDVARDLANQLSAAHAHDALVVDEDPIDETPVLREIEAACPVSPAPAWEFTGSWDMSGLRAAIGAGTADETVLDELAKAVAA